jgi:hypothetical protein
VFIEAHEFSYINKEQEMSDRAVTAPAKSQDVSIQQQNDVSANAIALKFLNEMSSGLKGDLSAGSQAQDLLSGLQGDPLQKQTLNQIATDMNDTAMMTKLGLTGSVQKGANGDVLSLSFSSEAGVQNYNNQLLTLEKSGVTPTQAESTLDSESTSFSKGAITLNADGLTPAEDLTKAQQAAAPPAPTDNQGSGTGITVNNGVDYDDINY